MAVDLEVSKQIAEFSQSVQTALQMFKGQDTLIKALQNQVDALERKALESVQTSVLSSNGMGFTDAKLAKNFVQLVKGIFIKEDSMVKDMTTAVDPDGGYLILPEYRNTLIMIMEQYGLARQRCTVIPMSTSELIMPRLTGGVQVYWIGEGQTMSQTQPAFGEFRMSIKKLAALVPMTSELLNDASIAIANLLATLFAQALAKEEDRVCFVGDVAGNADPYNGVFHDPGVKTYTMPTGKNKFTDITADDLANVIASQPPTLISGAQFYMHRTIHNVLRQLKDTYGQYIWAAPTADGQPGTIWGYPYSVSELLPAITATGASKPFIFFGNLQHYYIADRQQMTVARSEHVGFAQDKIFLRVLQREGMAYALPETGVVVKTAA